MPGKFIKDNFIPILIIIFLPFVFLYKLVLNPTNVFFPATDILYAYSQWRNLYAQNLFENKILALWNPFEFSGTPLIANASSGIMYPFTILFLIFPTDIAFGYGFLLDLILLGFFSYLFVRSLGIGGIGALSASIILTFSGTVFTRIYPGHLFILDTFLWMPLLLYFVEKAFNKENFIYFFYASIPIALMIVSGNPQIVLYGFFFTLVYIFLRILLSKEKKVIFKYSVGIMIALLFGVLLSSGQIIPLLEFSRVSSRGGGVDYLFASSFSLPPKQLISFFMPFFFGSPIDGTFWGKGNFWELNGYIGVGSLIFAVFAFLNNKNIYVKIFIFLSLFSLFFSLGSYSFLFHFFYKFVPLFNLFRVPARFIFFYALSISVLAGIGIHFILNNKKSNLTKTIKNISVIFIFLGSTLSILSISLNSTNFQDLFEKLVLRNSYAIGVDHKILYRHVIFSFSTLSIFLLLSSIVIFTSQIKNLKKISGFLVILLLIIELFIFDSQFLETKKVSNYYKIPEEIKFIKNDKDVFRIYDFSTGTFSLAEREKIENVTGYNPTNLAYYKNFFWNLGPHKDNLSDSYIQITQLQNFNILRLLNVKYLLSKDQISNNNLVLVYKKDFYVYKLLNTLPRAYLIDINTKESKDFKLPPDIIKANVVRNNPNTLSIKLNIKKRKKLVLSEIFYPGWIAYDNNKEISLEKYYIFRSINLKEGEHVVRLIYKPMSLEVGKWISIIALLILISLTVINKKIS